MNEEWRPVIGFEDSYEVSNLGRVRSKTRMVKNGKTSMRLQEGNIRKTSITRLGYENVGMSKDCKEKKYYVHRLVAQAFIPNTEDKETVNHIDGVKTNNCVSNLEWATLKENIQHSFDINIRKIATGSRNGNAKLSDEDVQYIRENSDKNGGTMTTVELRKKFNVHHSTISEIIKCETRLSALNKPVKQAALATSSGSIRKGWK